MKLKSQLRLLLAQKEHAAGRSISLREVQRETGVPISAVMGLANNTLREIPVVAVERLCAYFNCDVGDLLVLVKDETPSA